MRRRRLSVQPSSYNIAKKQNGNLRICTTLGRYFEFELIKAKSEKGYDQFFIYIGAGKFFFKISNDAI